MPRELRNLELKAVDNIALMAFKIWQDMPERKVDWDWTFASKYCYRYPKAFDLSVWGGTRLFSLTLGRPTYKGKSIRMDYIEKTARNCPYSENLFAVSLLAYETYGNLIGADSIRIIEPTNKKLVDYYMSHDGGFRYVNAAQGNPHYLVKKI